MRIAVCPNYLHFHDLASHFLSLAARDRFLRFGWVLSDVDIVDYVERLFRSIGSVFVVLEPAPDISGALHMEFGGSGAELGLSVSAWARGKGIGSMLLERAGLIASARGARTLFVRNLSFNTALQKLGRRAGMNIACAASTRSTRLELSPGGRRGGPLGSAITLADHSLRSCWDRPAADTAAVPAEQTMSA